MQTNQLIQELTTVIDNAIFEAEGFKNQPLESLNAKANVNSWSILQCIEHLNLYGNYYLKELEERIHSTKYRQKTATFKSGIIGNYFVSIIHDNDRKKKKKMKSPKDMTPSFSELTYATIDQFIKQLKLIKKLLIEAENIDWNKTKTSIALTSLIKLRLGDTFRFLVYHIDRHIKQAKQTSKAMGEL